MAESVLMPKLGLTMTEGTVNNWYKNEGDTVKKGEAVCEISSEKLSQDVEAHSDGVLLKILVPAGGEVACKEPIGVIGQLGENIEGAQKEAPVESKASIPQVNTEKAVVKNSEPAQPAKKRINISPLAKKMAAEKGIDLTKVTGTGGNGRITKQDIENYREPVQEATPEMASDPVQIASGAGLSGMRKIIAKNMMNSMHSTAQVTLQRKINITELMALRKEMRTKIGDLVSSGTFSLNIYLVRAIALALKEVPEMNAHYDGREYARKASINIGIAVALEEGLIVPVIKNADQLSLSQLTKEFGRVTTAAKTGGLAADDMAEGTFSLTNMGGDGIEYFTPILNTPEVGILGVGALSSRITFDESGVITEVKELPLSLTFDHQVIDGAPAAVFLKELANFLEHPYLLMV